MHHACHRNAPWIPCPGGSSEIKRLGRWHRPVSCNKSGWTRWGERRREREERHRRYQGQRAKHTSKAGSFSKAKARHDAAAGAIQKLSVHSWKTKLSTNQKSTKFVAEKGAQCQKNWKNLTNKPANEWTNLCSFALCQFVPSGFFLSKWSAFDKNFLEHDFACAFPFHIGSQV